MVEDYIRPQPSIILEILTSLRCGLCKVAHCLSGSHGTGYLSTGSVWDFVVLTSRYFWANWYIWLHTCILLFLLLFDEYSKLVVLLSCLHLVCVPLFIPHCFGWEGWEGWKCCWDLITTCFCFVAWSSFNLSCYSQSAMLGAIRWDSFCLAMHTSVPIFPKSMCYFASALNKCVSFI